MPMRRLFPPAKMTAVAFMKSPWVAMPFPPRSSCLLCCLVPPGLSEYMSVICPLSTLTAVYAYATIFTGMRTVGPV